MSIHNRTEFGFDQSTSMKYLFIHYNYTPTEVLRSIKKWPEKKTLGNN